MSCSDKIRLFISPCPNDTFVFYGLLHGVVDTHGLDYQVVFEDIENLNNRLLRQDGDVIKASIAVASSSDYHILNSGAALGRGNGPVVVRGGVRNKVVALPGVHTTAKLLFNRFFEGYDEQYMLFSDVAGAVSGGQAELGVLIHEGRFTFAQHGLEFVADLGQLWEQQTGLPLPLGAIFASPNLDPKVRSVVDQTIKASVQWAMEHRSQTMEFVACHARELSLDVINAHIDTFVNQYTIELDQEAISMMMA